MTAALGERDQSEVVEVPERQGRLDPPAGEPARADVRALFERATGHREAGRFDEAVADFTACLRFDPAFVSAYVGRGEAQRQGGRHERAAADHGHALGLDPHNLAALAGRAAALAALGRHERALADLGAALRLDAGNGRARLLRADSLAALGRHAEALEELDRACADGAWPAARRARAAARLRGGDAAGARRDLDAAVALAPSDPLAWSDRGLLRLGRGDAAGAAEDLGEALALAPDLAEARLGRARAWAARGRHDLAEADCSEALARRPGCGEALLLRGACRGGRGDRGGARADLDAAVAADPGSAAARRARGAEAARRGGHAAALADLAEAARLDPADAEAAALAAASLAALDRPEEALAELRRAALLDARHAPALCSLRASLHAARGDFEEALADLAVVLRLDPTNVEALAAREQAVLGLRLATPARRAGRRAAPATEILRVVKAAETQPALPALGADVEIDPAAFLMEGTVDAPPLPADAAPDRAVEPPGRTDVGPIEARRLKEERQAKAKERAALWSSMAAGSSPAPAPTAAVAPPDDRPPAVSLWQLAAAALFVLLLGGGVWGTYYLLSAESKLNATDAWKAFHADPAAAGRKYQGRFVQVTGKAKVIQGKGEARTFFDAPAAATWGIEFVLGPADQKKVKDGAAVTVRGRFATSKGQPRGSNITMSNCSLVAAPGS